MVRHDGIKFHHVLFLVYIVSIHLVAVQSAWLRYLIPVLPFFFAYAFWASLGWVASLPGAGGAWRCWGGALVVVAAVYLVVYLAAPRLGPTADVPSSKDFGELAHAVRESVPEDSVVMIRSLSWLSLLSDCLTVASPRSEHCCQRENGQLSATDDIRRLDARNVVLRHGERKVVGLYQVDRLGLPDVASWQRLVTSNPQWFESIGSFGDMEPYKIRRDALGQTGD